MRRTLHHIVALLTSALLLPGHGVVYAEPDIGIQTEYYAVSGTDLPTIYQSLQNHGPPGRRGSNYHAHTQWDIRWGYRWIDSDGRCRITGVDVSITISYLLPRLESYSSLPEKVRQSWDRYYSALLRHEEHHKDYGIQAARELERVLLAISPRDCFGLESYLSRQAKAVIARYDALEQAYDRETDHGILEGVILQ